MLLLSRLDPLDVLQHLLSLDVVLDTSNQHKHVLHVELEQIYVLQQLLSQLVYQDIT